MVKVYTAYFLRCSRSTAPGIYMLRFIYFSKKRNIGTTLFIFDAHRLYHANLSA